MSLPRSDSAESICTILTRASEEYEILFENESLLTEGLSHDALQSIIRPNSEKLRAADGRYRLDDLLHAMLKHAPHPLGRRYVAVCLHIAHQKGEEGVVNAAKAWLDNLLLPMLAISRRKKAESASSQTSIIDATMEHIESATRDDQRVLRNTVALRERYRCAITKVFDDARAEKLLRKERFDEIPEGVGQHPMDVTHIVPFLVDGFDGYAITNSQINDGARTWDMLRSWTHIDFMALVGSNINSPANAIYMTTVEHDSFGRFKFYLDKEEYPDIPNKYRVRMTRRGITLTNGSREVDVEFRTQEESSVEPPDHDYLKVHAAFARVLHLCGATEYIERVEKDAEMEGTLRQNGETDFATYLQSKLLWKAKKSEEIKV